MLKFTGYDAAILGFTEAWFEEPKLVYDGEKIIQQLIAEGMTDEEAHEFCSFNIEGAYVGDATPIIIWPYDEEDCEDAPET